MCIRSCVHFILLSISTTAATVVPPQEAQLRSTEAIVFDEQPPEKLEVNVGEDVVLTCRAHSRTGEQVEYQWFQGEEEF